MRSAFDSGRRAAKYPALHTGVYIYRRDWKKGGMQTSALEKGGCLGEGMCQVVGPQHLTTTGV